MNRNHGEAMQRADASHGAFGAAAAVALGRRENAGGREKGPCEGAGVREEKVRDALLRSIEKGREDGIGELRGSRLGKVKKDRGEEKEGKVEEEEEEEEEEEDGEERRAGAVGGREVGGEKREEDRGEKRKEGGKEREEVGGEKKEKVGGQKKEKVGGEITEEKGVEKRSDSNKTDALLSARKGSDVKARK
ncbi:unnamed protein product, partial [Closterium sp. NIES-53]